MSGATKISNRVREEYERILIKEGEDKVYRHALGAGIINLAKHKFPELLLLDQSEAFFSAFRQTGNKNYFTIGKALRKAAHRLYRQLQKANENYPTSTRFLHIIKI